MQTEENQYSLSKLEAELINKTREVASTLGKEDVSSQEGKEFELNCEDGFNISYRIDWGGRQYLSVSQYGEIGQKNRLFTANNNGKKDSPERSEVKVGDGEFEVTVHHKGVFNWQQRVDDMYLAIETLKKKYSIK